MMKMKYNFLNIENVKSLLNIENIEHCPFCGAKLVEGVIYTSSEQFMNSSPLDMFQHPYNECILSEHIINCADIHKWNKRVKNTKRGKWIMNTGACYDEPAYYCSVCFDGESKYGLDKYCNNCGIEMENKF